MFTNDTHVVEYAPPTGISIFEACYLLNHKITKEAIVGTIMGLGFRKYFRVEFSDTQNVNDFVLYRDALYPKDDNKSREESLILGSIYENFDVDNVKLGEVGERIAMNGITLSELEGLSKENLLKNGHIKEAVFRKFEKSRVVMSVFFLVIILFLTFLPWLIRTLTEASYFAEINPEDYFLFPVTLIVLIFLLSVTLKRINVIEDIPTESGLKLLRKINGFRVYLEIAEKDRIKFFQSTEAERLNITELLPYSILFGLEKSWLKEIFVWKNQINDKQFKIEFE